MNTYKINELPIEVCKSKSDFVERFLKPLVKALDLSVTDVIYDYVISGDSRIDESVEIRRKGGSFLSIDVSRDSKAQLSVDTLKALSYQ